MRMLWLFVVLPLLLPAFQCSNSPPAEARQECPQAINDAVETWGYVGDDLECAAIAEQLNQAQDDSTCMGEVASLVIGLDKSGKCVAELSRACGDIAIGLSCDVQPNGDADCKARITWSSLTNGSCDLTVKERSQ